MNASIFWIRGYMQGFLPQEGAVFKVFSILCCLESAGWLEAGTCSTECAPIES